MTEFDCLKGFVMTHDRNHQSKLPHDIQLLIVTLTFTINCNPDWIPVAPKEIHGKIPMDEEIPKKQLRGRFHPSCNPHLGCSMSCVHAACDKNELSNFGGV